MPSNLAVRLNEDHRKHGRGVAYAARKQGILAVICLSSLVPKNKQEAIKTLGDDVWFVGSSQDEAEVEAIRLTEEEGLPNSDFTF